MADPTVLQQVPPPPTPPAPPRYTIFRGPNGIRAGWRVLIFLVLAVVIGFVISLPFFVLRHGAPPNRAALANGLNPIALSGTEGTSFLVLSLAALIMARIERRKFGAYGLPIRSAFQKNFWIGTVIGFSSISVSLLGIFAFHGFHITGLAIHGTTIASAIGAWTVAFVLVGLSEEFSFRGYLQYTLTTGMGFWPSAILLSLLFALVHYKNPGETKAGLLSIIVFALLFCLFLRRTGNLWLPVGFHVGWDWGQTFFYGVPDSGLQPYHNLLSSTFSGKAWLTGGTVGPEASIFTPIVLGIVALLFSRVCRENRYQAP